LGVAIASMLPLNEQRGWWNERISVLTRYAAKRLEPSESSWTVLEDWLVHHFSQVFPNLQPITRMKFQEYNNREQVPAATRRDNWRAYQDILAGQVCLKRAAVMETFDKLENQLKAFEVGLADSSDVEEFAIRMIVNVSAVARVTLGRSAAPLQDALGHSWDDSHYLFYDSSKVSYTDTAKFITKAWDSHHCALKIDMSKCDMHHSPQSFRATEEFYRRANAGEHFLRLWRLFYTSQKVRGRYGLRLKRAFGGLPTGSPNTTLQNTLTVGLLIDFVLEQIFHLTPTRDFVGIGKGDDWNVFVAPTFSAKAFREEMAKFGFKCKAEFVTEIEKLSFCSNLYVPARLRRTGEVLYVPSPTCKSFKCAFSPRFGFKDRRAYCNGVAKGLEAVARFNPLLDIFVKTLAAVGQGQTFTGSKLKYFDKFTRLQMKYPGRTEDFDPMPDRAWASLASRYCLPVGVLQRAGDQLRHCRQTGLLGSSEWSQLTASVIATDLA